MATETELAAEYERLFSEIAAWTAGGRSVDMSRSYIRDDVTYDPMSVSPAGRFAVLAWRLPPPSRIFAYLRPDAMESRFGPMCRCDVRDGGRPDTYWTSHNSMAALAGLYGTTVNRTIGSVKAEPAVSTWIPMSVPGDVAALAKLLEELNECGSAAARCLAQGIDGREPTTGKPNRQWLEDEIADVRALCDVVVNRFRLDIDGDRKRRKFMHKTAWLKALDEGKETH